MTARWEIGQKRGRNDRGRKEKEEDDQEEGEDSMS